MFFLMYFCRLQIKSYFMDTAVLERSSIVCEEAWTKAVMPEKKKSFEEAMASAISGEELRQRMYRRIDAWQWKEK